VIHITQLETGILLLLFLVVCGVFAITLLGSVSSTIYFESPTQAEIKERAEIQAKWNGMIDAIRDGDEEKIKEISAWLDKHAGTSFEKLEDAKARLICAWCGKDMGEANTSQDTHGICESCKGVYFPSSGKE